MNGKSIKLAWAAAGALTLFAAGAHAGQVTVFEQANYQGRSLTTSAAVTDLERSAFSGVVASAIVGDGTWEVCTESYFRGRCAQLLPGNYDRFSDSGLMGRVASLRQVSAQPRAPQVVVRTEVVTPAAGAVAVPLVVDPDPRPVVVGTPVVSAPVVTAPVVSASAVNASVVSAPVVTAPVVTAPIVTAPVVSTTPVVTGSIVVAATPVVSAAPIPAGPRVVLYQRTTAPIRAIELTASVDDLGSRRFDDRADSAFVSSGIWRLCEGKRGGGTCTEYGPGQYLSLGALDGRVSSAYFIASAQPSVVTTAAIPTGRAVFYQFPNFAPPSAVVEYGRAPDMNWANFRGPAASARVESGSWLVCSEMGYQGDCRVLDVGEYPELTRVLASGVASARQVWRPEVALSTTRTDYGSLDLYRMQ